jgi:hypothetical protein
MSQSEKSLEEKDTTRRTIFIVVALGSALLVAGLVYLATRPASRTGEARLEGAMRPDSKEFEPFRERLLVEFNADEQATQADRPLGDVVITMNPTVRNFTGRTIDGLELRAVGLDLSGNVVKERHIIAVPARQAELAPNKTLTVPITFEGIKKENVPASLKVELSGVKFK